jgi:hypothetical protein
MQESSPPTEAQFAWFKVFGVLQPPSRANVQFLRTGYQIQVGDFAWASPRCPKEKEGMVHLAGYDEKFLNIWSADVELSQLRYVGPKPASYPQGMNPFPVKAPTPSVALYIGRFKHFFFARWSWYKTRHIRKENFLKYRTPKNEKA